MLRQQDFKAPWWLKNKHLQSCYSSMVTYRAKAPTYYEEFNLPDGDFIDIVWAGPENGQIAIMLHGLEGSVESHYIQVMIDSLVQSGRRVAVMQYRTCSGRLNRFPANYHGGDTRDLSFFLKVLFTKYPKQRFDVVGFSLGGNILLRFLSENISAPIRRAIAVSTPFDMRRSADHLGSLYQWVLLRSMKQKVLGKINAGYRMPVSPNELKKVMTLRHFDTLVTAPLFGYSSADDYYQQSSCGPVLRDIRHPTLILHAMDDPFIPRDTVPKESELSPHVTLEISEQGGHVGFIGGKWPWRPEFWFKGRILEFLEHTP